MPISSAEPGAAFARTPGAANVALTAGGGRQGEQGRRRVSGARLGALAAAGARKAL